MQLRAYVDSDWGTDIDTSRSTSGFVIYLGNNIVNFKSRLQRSVSKSSTEAEYKAAGTMTAYLLYHIELIEELGYIQNKPITFYEYNQDYEQLCQKTVGRSKTRHIKREYHFVRERVVDFMDMEVIHIDGEINPADSFTKAMDKNKFQTMTYLLKNS